MKVRLIYRMTVCKVVEAETLEAAEDEAFYSPPYPNVDGVECESADVDSVEVECADADDADEPFTVEEPNVW